MSERSEAGDRQSDSRSLAVRPAPGAWRSLLRQNRSNRAVTMRRELGLPVGRPLLMTGHQVEFWHPGILAKYLAADAAGGALGADIGWIFVDQDAQPTVQVRYPAREGDGRLVVRTREYSSARGSPLSPHDAVGPFVAAGLARIDEAMERHGDEPDLLRRTAAAVQDLMMPLVHQRPVCIFATRLSTTTVFGELVEEMRRRPERLCEIYNAAVGRHPGTGVRPLLVNQVQDQYELPLWHLTPEGGRRRVYLEMLQEVPVEQLAPRALLMTGLLRLAACDLFIHGTGGGGRDDTREGYDRITEEWLSAWLDLPGDALAPATVVTATLRLPHSATPPTREEVALSAWRAHHARHDPASVGDSAGAAYKRRLVAALATAEPGERPLLFERLQQFLAEYREHHRDGLAGFAAEARRARERLKESTILLDRTWPFPLYPEGALRGLKSRIEEAFS